MIYRILMFTLSIVLLFIPVYLIVNWIYKKVHIINETSELKDEFEKNINSKKILEKELSSKLKDLEIEQKKLKNINKTNNKGK